MRQGGREMVKVGPSERKGSVLMEFLVVLPLYFTLVGGLFFIGELMINRVRLQIGDFAVTWIGADRFSDPSLCGSAMEFLFEEKFDGRGTYVVNESEDAEKVNRFCALHLGGVDLDIVMPSWILGMLFVQDVTTGPVASEGDSEPRWDKLDTHSFWMNDENERKSLFRSFSIHRVLNDDMNYERARKHEIAGVERGRIAADLLVNNVLLNVLSDRWVNNVEESPLPAGAGESLTVLTEGAQPRILSGFGQ